MNRRLYEEAVHRFVREAVEAVAAGIDCAPRSPGM
jgi:hypothetical protein